MADSPTEAARLIFDREVEEMVEDMEPSTRVHWFEQVRDEVLAAVAAHDDPTAERPTTNEGHEAWKVTQTSCRHCGQTDWSTDAARLDAAEALLRDARAELNEHGFGDFHYGQTPRDPDVLAMLARIDAFLAAGGVSDAH